MNIRVIGQKIYSQVIKSNNVLVVCHQDPDADALGSLVAIGAWLKSLDITHTKFCKHPSPPNLDWLSSFEPLVTDEESLLNQKYDLIILVDSGDLEYAGVDKIISRFDTKPFIINIDHHATNKFFGNINLVDPTASSTTEIIYQLFKDLKINIAPIVASALLSGIIGDTYNFTNPNVNDRSLSIASGLLLSGASLPSVNSAILKNKSIAGLQLWGKILSRLSYNKKYDIATTVVTEEDLKDFEADYETVAGISNFLNNLSNIKASLILIQQGKWVKGSFRANNDLIDVSKLAKILGGGGHKKAAGFKVKGHLSQSETGSWQII